jgi:hypothetical protein
MNEPFLQIFQWATNLSGSEAAALFASFCVGLALVAGVVLRRREARRDSVFFSFPTNEDYTHRRRNAGTKIYVGR